MKLSKFIGEVSGINREIIGKGKLSEKLERIEKVSIVVSNDEELNQLYADFQIAWLDEEHTKLCIYPVGQPEPEAELTPEDMAKFEAQLAEPPKLTA